MEPIIKLIQIKDEANADIDIVGIHGIDCTDDLARERWLLDQSLVPSRVEKANVWLCDWREDLLLLHKLQPGTLKDVAQGLLDALGRALPRGSDSSRPILFIASCFGGVLLMKALSLGIHPASLSPCTKSFSGVIFLDTPFGSTSLKRMIQWAKPMLGSWAMPEGRALGPILQLFYNTTTEIDKIVQDFTTLVTTDWNRALECQITIFRSRYLRAFKSDKTELTSKFDCFAPEMRRGSQSAPFEDICRTVEGSLKNIRSRSAVLSDADKELLRRYRSMIQSDQLSRQTGSSRLREAEYVDEKSRDAETLKWRPPEAILTAGDPTKRPIIGLQHVFDDRKDRLGKISQPRRIFIQGRPGIGKTTLCKKAVDGHINHGLWKSQFDRVLWISLRNLTLRDGGDLSDLLSDLLLKELFSNCYNSERFVGAMVEECIKNGGKRTLFIMDGLDEIWHRKVPPHSLSRALVLQLLNMPNVIVTSRQRSALLLEAETFHLELEVMEFDSDQIDEYFHSLGMGSSYAIKKVAKSTPICRVPIYLDALRLGWDDITDKSAPTATKICDAFLTRVKRENEELGSCLAILGGVALAKLIDEVPFDDFETPENLRLSMSNIPFIQESQGSGGETEKVLFHFVHPIFLEFFAAREIAELWVNERETARSLFHKNKYAPGFGMVWRFVTGLLSDQKDVAIDFFNEVNEAPFDLLGPAHQRLLVSLLQEDPQLEESFNVWLSSNKVIKLFGLEELPAGFLLRIAKLEPLISRSIWRQRHQLFSRSVRKEALEALGVRQDVTEEVEKEIATFLGHEHKDVRVSAADALRSIGNLQASALEVITVHLKSKDEAVREAAMNALKGSQISESDQRAKDIIDAVVGWLQSGGSTFMAAHKRSLALSALRGWPCQSEDITKAIITCLEFGASEVRRAAVYAVGSMPEEARSPDLYKAVIERLADKSTDVRWATVYTLKGMQNIPKEELEDAARELLKHPDTDVRKAILECLQTQPDLSELLVDAIADGLRDADIHCRITSVKVLKRQNRLSSSTTNRIAIQSERPSERPPTSFVEKILSKVSNQGKNEAVAKRVTALDCLRDNSDFEASTIRIIAQYLDGDDLDLRWAAAFVLKSPGLEIPIETVMRCVGHEDLNIARAATDVIMNKPDLCYLVANRILSQSSFNNDEPHTWKVDGFDQLKHIPNLSNSMIDFVVAADKETTHVRRAAVETLQGQSNLPVSALQRIATTWLGDEDEAVRCAAESILKCVPDLPLAVGEAIGKGLRTPSTKSRITALHALASLPALPREGVDEIVKCLDSQSGDLRGAALYALKDRRNLHIDITQKFVQLLNNEDSNYIVASLHGLKGGLLSSEELEAITKCLDHTRLDVRQAAADALKDQPGHLASSQEKVDDWFGKEDANYKRAAIYALEGHSNIHTTMLNKVADCIGTTDARLISAASDALRGWVSTQQLEKSTVESIAAWIKPRTDFTSTILKIFPTNGTTASDVDNLEVRKAALNVLQDLQDLSPDTCVAIAQCLDDKDIDLRWSAVYALKDRPTLPESALNVVGRCLRKKKVSDIKWGALEVLKGNTNIPEKTIEMVAECLQHRERGLRSAAFEIIKDQKNLSDSTRNTLIRFKEFDTRSTFQLIQHKDILRVLLTAETEASFKALTQELRERYSLSLHHILLLPLLLHPVSYIILLVMAHKKRQILSDPRKDMTQKILEERSESFLNALFWTAQNYHLVWSIDEGQYRVQTEERDLHQIT